MGGTRRRRSNRPDALRYCTTFHSDLEAFDGYKVPLKLWLGDHSCAHCQSLSVRSHVRVRSEPGDASIASGKLVPPITGSNP